jgi:hypothetical protein
MYYTKDEALDDAETLELIEMNVYCLHKIFANIKMKRDLKSFIKKIDLLLKQKKYKPKLKFKLMDIKDFY